MCRYARHSRQGLAESPIAVFSIDNCRIDSRLSIWRLSINSAVVNRESPIRKEALMALRLNRNAGMTVLGVYLLVAGISGLVSIGLPPVLMSVLALVAGILILAGR
jgi:hypothetical protein